MHLRWLGTDPGRRERPRCDAKRPLESLSSGVQAHPAQPLAGSNPVPGCVAVAFCVLPSVPRAHQQGEDGANGLGRLPTLGICLEGSKVSQIQAPGSSLPRAHGRGGHSEVSGEAGMA